MIRRWFAWWYVHTPDDGMWCVQFIPDDHEQRVLLFGIDGSDDFI